MDQIPAAAKTAHILPGLSNSLISIGKLCDAGMTATFNKNTVGINKDNKTVLTGHRHATTGLWMLPLAPPTCACTSHQCQQIITTQSISDMIKYLHAAAGRPSKSRLLNAISKGYFQTWTGFTKENVQKHLVESDATVKGHLDHVQKYLRSTKTK